MTKPSCTRHAVIAQSSSLARNAVRPGPGAPGNQRDAVQRARLGDRKAAGRFGPTAASFVNHKEVTLLFPHSLHSAQFGSVTTRLVQEGLV